MGGKHTAAEGRAVQFRSPRWPSPNRTEPTCRLSGAAPRRAPNRAIAGQRARSGIGLSLPEGQTAILHRSAGRSGPSMPQVGGREWGHLLPAPVPLRSARAYADPDGGDDRAVRPGAGRREERELAELRVEQAAIQGSRGLPKRPGEDTFRGRLAKRRLFFRDPDLGPLESLLFVKRHAFEPSHNYSVLLDSRFRPGGGVYTIRTSPAATGVFGRDEATLDAAVRRRRRHRPEPDGQLRPVARSTSATGPPANGYYHIMSMAPDGSEPGAAHRRAVPRLLALSAARRRPGVHLHALPGAVPLLASAGGRAVPHGRRRRSRHPPAVVRQPDRMGTLGDERRPDHLAAVGVHRQGGRLQPHAVGDPPRRHASRSWSSATRSSSPTATPTAARCRARNEICCTLISHFGDLNGPIALVDTDKGRFNPEAITSITPEVPWPGMWPAEECFRDPFPIARDYFLCSPRPAAISSACT